MTEPTREHGPEQVDRDRHELGHRQIGDPFLSKTYVFGQRGEIQGLRCELHVLSTIERGEHEVYTAPCGAISQSDDTCGSGVEPAAFGSLEELKRGADDICYKCLPEEAKEAAMRRAESVKPTALISGVGALAVEQSEEALGRVGDVLPTPSQDGERLLQILKNEPVVYAYHNGTYNTKKTPYFSAETSEGVPSAFVICTQDDSRNSSCDGDSDNFYLYQAAVLPVGPIYKALQDFAAGKETTLRVLGTHKIIDHAYGYDCEHPHELDETQSVDFICTMSLAPNGRSATVRILKEDKDGELQPFAELTAHSR